jgi:hypothetical protein
MAADLAGTAAPIAGQHHCSTNGVGVIVDRGRADAEPTLAKAPFAHVFDPDTLQITASVELPLPPFTGSSMSLSPRTRTRSRRRHCAAPFAGVSPMLSASDGLPLLPLEGNESEASVPSTSGRHADRLCRASLHHSDPRWRWRLALTQSHLPDLGPTA